jgi:diguanylate cyclase (GGDEF)-like protein
MTRSPRRTQSSAQRTHTWRDQATAQREGAVAQREQAAGRGEQAVHDRQQGSGAREVTVTAREHAADRRDTLADERDERAAERGAAAVERDSEGTKRDALAAAAEDEVAQAPNLSAGAVQALAAARRGAKSDRMRAGGDRWFASRDRSHAKADRDAAAGDRRAASTERESALFDELTGVLLRGPGFFELTRDIARAQRSGDPLVLAFADVVALKAVNDSVGHIAADKVLRRIAETLRGNLRPYDTIVRFGGDEFVCAISGLSNADVKERLAAVNLALAGEAPHASVTIGLAQLQADDTLETLLERADADLYRQRSGQESRLFLVADTHRSDAQFQSATTTNTAIPRAPHDGYITNSKRSDTLSPSNPQLDSDAVPGWLGHPSSKETS